MNPLCKTPSQDGGTHSGGGAGGRFARPRPAAGVSAARGRGQGAALRDAGALPARGHAGQDSGAGGGPEAPAGSGVQVSRDFARGVTSPIINL